MSSPIKPSLSLIRYRKLEARKIPTAVGVYAICDLDEVPIYVGQSNDGIRKRVQRHITSARSDIIANRMIDVWEVAFVWSWPWNDVSQLNVLEAHLFHGFHKKSKLMNGSIPLTPPPLDFEIPDPVVVQLMPNEEIESRKRAPLRLTRQAQHFSNLLDQFLNVKDSQELYLALRAHFERLNRYFERLRGSTEPTEPEE
jgi:hypothetical protein